jgi:hypothetical protein
MERHCNVLAPKLLEHSVGRFCYLLADFAVELKGVIGGGLSLQVLASCAAGKQD